MAITTSKSPTFILCLFFLAVLLATLPFFIAQMVIYYQYLNGDSVAEIKQLQPNTAMHCLSTIEPNTKLTLG